MLITIFQSVSYYQVANVFQVWVQQHVDLSVGSLSIPIAWYQSIDPLVSILAVPLLFGIWQLQASRRGEPSDLGKIGVGAWLAATANLILVVAIVSSGGEPIHPLWPALYCAGLGVAFLYYWPTLLALVSRAAPASANATMMGIAFLTLFVSNNLIGWVGRFYEQMSPTVFWTMHAGIAATGGVLVMVFGRRLTRALHVEDAQPMRPSAMTLEVER
jgi:POT family proton-dependent oligopeptide transporter